VVLDSLLRADYLIWEANALATKAKKSTTNTADTKVTRITATDVAAEKPQKKANAPAKAPAETGEKKRRNPLRAIGGYFKGAWYELKQVRWPNRRATWGMTAALLGFTAFFVVFILLLDALFKYLFEVILG
jgi:preprotein translocase subunit SecE